ncbi:MAG TPA: ABC transporter ATP-binding protein, partial [Polyangiaceae bacterium]|nr:ABC transporter ATP-binding protein [Polyangiaceae bacterium]
DLDPNEKAEVIKYIQDIGKDRTVLLSTHNLGEVEQACARAIIVSKGRVVADGQLDEIRSRTGSVRYLVTVDETGAEGGRPAPSAGELKQAFERVGGIKTVKELPTDETAHKLELSGAQDGDARAEIFRLIVQRGWTLLELRRDAQSLDAVFRDLTQSDEAADRGRSWSRNENEEDDEDEDEADEADDSTDEAEEKN